jgi:hypothetical protein
MVYLLLRRDSPRAALIAACGFAVLPMTLVFGGLADVISPQLDFFVLLTVAAYLRFHERPNAHNLALISLAFLPAALTDWPAFHLVLILAAHFALTKPFRQWPWMIAFGLFSIAFFMISYVQVVMVMHDWTWIAHLVQRRALSNVADSSTRFTCIDWINKAVLGHAVARHTWPVMILAAAWLVGRAIRSRDKSTRAVRATTLVFAWAILHIVVGRQGVFVHEWWWWPLTPPSPWRRDCSWISCANCSSDVACACPSCNTTIAALLIAFATVNTLRAARELANPNRVSDDPPLNYSLVELGQVIRDAAPPNEAVMLAESDKSMSLWYYADRPLKREVWDPYTFEKRLTDGNSDLLFGLTEQWDRRPVAFVFPKAYRSEKTEPLLEYLGAYYTRRELAKFLVFDLRMNRTTEDTEVTEGRKRE